MFIDIESLRSSKDSKSVTPELIPPYGKGGLSGQIFLT